MMSKNQLKTNWEDEIRSLIECDNYELMIHSEALAQFMLQHICHFGSKKPVLMGKNNPLTEITQEMGNIKIYLLSAAFGFSPFPVGRMCSTHLLRLSLVFLVVLTVPSESSRRRLDLWWLE